MTTQAKIKTKFSDPHRYTESNSFTQHGTKIIFGKQKWDIIIYHFVSNAFPYNL